MPKYKIAMEPKPSAKDSDPGERADPPMGVMRRAKEFLSGRMGERREKKRTRAPRHMVGRRG